MVQFATNSVSGDGYLPRSVAAAPYLHLSSGREIHLTLRSVPAIYSAVHLSLLVPVCDADRIQVPIQSSGVTTAGIILSFLIPIADARQ